MRRSQLSLNVMPWVGWLSNVQNSAFCLMFVLIVDDSWIIPIILLCILVPQPVLHALLLCSKCSFLHHGFHSIVNGFCGHWIWCSSFTIKQKSSVQKTPNSPIQHYWYFSGCIIKLNNPLWLEAKWWNSFQWPQLNHKQKAFWCLCISKASPDCQNAIISAEHEIWAQTDGTLLVNVSVFSCSSDRCFDYRPFTSEVPVLVPTYGDKSLHTIWIWSLHFTPLQPGTVLKCCLYLIVLVLAYIPIL